jgi:hypothetical protein
MFYMISPMGPTAWQVSQAELDDLLEGLWPGVRSQIPGLPTDTRALEWDFANGDAWLSGFMTANGQQFYLRGFPDLIAQFAVALKSRFAPSEEILLCSEDLELVQPLAGQDVGDIVRVLTS